MKKESFLFFLLNALFLIIISHGTLYGYGRNINISFLVIFIEFIFISFIYLFSNYSRNSFLLLILIYILSHFTSFLYGGGGLFNYLSFLLLFLIILFPPYDFNKQKKGNNKIIILLLCINGMGYLTSDLELSYIINGFVVFIGIIFIFYISIRVKLNESRIKILILSAAILGIINLLITLNTSFKIINIQSPLFTSIYEINDYQLFANTGSLGTIELFGEWGMLNSFFILPFITLKNGLKRFDNIQKTILYIGYFSSVICALLSFSKSIFILIILGTFLYLIYYVIFFAKFKTLLKFIVILPLFLFVIPSLITFLNLDYILDRLYENPEFLQKFLENPLTAKGTTREVVYSLGLERIAEKNWFFGNGWSTPQGNYFSWFGSYIYLDYADFHNLYMCLIPIFGFSGLFIYLILFIKTILKSISNLRKFRFENSFFFPFIIGLVMVLIFFMINEFKINATRNSYFTISIIWLGLTINANNEFKNNKK